MPNPLDQPSCLNADSGASYAVVQDLGALTAPGHNLEKVSGKSGMNPNVFAEWLERQGHSIVRTPASFWYSAGPRVFQAFPHDWTIHPSETELTLLLRHHKYVALRYSTESGSPSGRISYHVSRCLPYSQSALSATARNLTSRGLRQCRIEQISCERLADEGWGLQQDTLQRQGREGSLDQARWRRICLAAKDLEAFEVWGALVGDALAAAILVARIDDVFHILYAQSLRKYLKQFVNNALVFKLTENLLSRPGIRSVFYGLESLDAPPSVDEFKFRMGYEAKPVRQRVVFHPLLAPLCNRLSHSLVSSIHRWRPGNLTLAKAEGLLRFYLELEAPVNPC